MPPRLPLAAALMIGAGGTHLAAAVPHFSSGPLYGLLLAGAGWVQLILAVVLLVWARAGVAWVAVAVNAAAIMAWGVSRTVGLPLAGPEPVLLADAVTVAFELGAIGVLAGRLSGVAFVFRSGRVVFVSLLAAVVLTVIGGSTLAIAGLGSDDHHAQGGKAGVGHEDGRQAQAGEGLHGGSPRDTTGATDSVHPHPDGSVHLHEAGKPHLHPNGTVHIHPRGETSPQEGASGHGDDQGHSHEGDEAH